MNIKGYIEFLISCGECDSAIALALLLLPDRRAADYEEYYCPDCLFDDLIIKNNPLK